MNNCLFCERSKIEKDILWESDNFFVKVGVGILAPGHILLITKHHIRCFGELDKKHFKEFLELKKNVFDKVKANFSEPIISEQGGYGQSVPHAHLHFVPTISNVHNIQNIKEKVFRGLKSTKIESMNEIKEIYNKEGSYIYFEENDNKLIFHSKGLTANKFTFRKEFAGLTGLYGLSSWQNMPEEEKKRSEEWARLTKEKLKSS